MAMFRRFWCAGGWLAIGALLGNVLMGVVPAKAARTVDELPVSLAVDAASCAQAFIHKGGTRKPAHPNVHCSDSLLDKLDTDVKFEAACLHAELPPPPHGTQRPTTPRARPTVDCLRLGGIGSRAPPATA